MYYDEMHFFFSGSQTIINTQRAVSDSQLPKSKAAHALYDAYNDSLSLSVFLCIYLSLSLYLSVCMSTCQPACLPVCLSVCLFVSAILKSVDLSAMCCSERI